MTDIKTLQKALDTYGIDAQMDMLVEECSEVIKAVCKIKRSSSPNEALEDQLLEELADVQIMIDQMRLYFGNNGANQMDDWRMVKIARLAERSED